MAPRSDVETTSGHSRVVVKGEIRQGLAIGGLHVHTPSAYASLVVVESQVRNRVIRSRCAEPASVDPSVVVAEGDSGKVRAASVIVHAPALSKGPVAPHFQVDQLWGGIVDIANASSPIVPQPWIVQIRNAPRDGEAVQLGGLSDTVGGDHVVAIVVAFAVEQGGHTVGVDCVIFAKIAAEHSNMG